MGAPEVREMVCSQWKWKAQTRKLRDSHNMHRSRQHEPCSTRTRFRIFLTEIGVQHAWRGHGKSQLHHGSQRSFLGAGVKKDFLSIQKRVRKWMHAQQRCTVHLETLTLPSSSSLTRRRSARSAKNFMGTVFLHMWNFPPYVQARKQLHARNHGKL